MRIELIESSLESLLNSAIEFYKERLLSFAIFGSYARKTANENHPTGLWVQKPAAK